MNNIKKTKRNYVNNSYNYSLTFVLFVPTISLKSLNINIVRFIEFLNDNSFIIFSGSLGLNLLSLFLFNKI